MDIEAQKLSGGEKARLLLGLATFEGPHLLILDEPTNHLDIDSREALVYAINDYEGAVLLISHDRHLIEACVDRLWLVHDGTCKNYDGDLQDYRKLLLSSRNSPNSSSNDKTSKKKSVVTQEPEAAVEKSSENSAEAHAKRRSSAEKRKEQAPLLRKIQAAERDMIKIRVRIEKTDEMLANPNLFARFPEKGAKLSKDRADLAALLEKIEEKWLEMSEQVED